MRENYDKVSAKRGIYNTLDDDQIRLVLILPGHTGAPLRFAFESYDLTESFSIYTAISYPWGPPEDEHHQCWVGIEPFTLRHNAYTVLSRVRRPDIVRKVWIDCLSIDQDDKAEKISQIKLMHRIYKQAAKTVIWLGGVVQGSDAIGDFIHQLDNDLIRREYQREWKEHPQKTFVLDLIEDNPFKQSLVDSIAQLFVATYWSRLWIRQEAAVGNNLEVLWGNFRLEWEQVVDLAWLYVPRGLGDQDDWYDKQFLEELDYDPVEEAIDTIRSIDLYRIYQRPGDKEAMTLFNQMFRARSGFTTKAHDKVYALVSLSDMTISMPGRRLYDAFLSPDYALSWQEVYVNAAKFFFFSSATVAAQVLNQAGLCHMGGGSDLPSWVPDWRYRCQRWTTIWTSWAAGGRRDSVRPTFTVLTRKQRAQLLTYTDYATILPLCASVPKDYCQISKSPAYIELKFRETLPEAARCKKVACKDEISKADFTRLESMHRAAVALEIQSCMEDTITYVSRLSKWDKFDDINRAEVRQDIVDIDGENLAFLSREASHRINGLYITSESLYSAYDQTLVSARDPLDNAPGPDLASTAATWRQWLVDDSIEDHASTPCAFHSAVARSFVFRKFRFAYTANGFMGLVPNICRVGDKITIINGYRVPFAVRPVVADWNMLIGGCYVHGMMTCNASELMEEFSIVFDKEQGIGKARRPQGDIRANGRKMEAGRYVDILCTLGTRIVKLI